MSLEIQLAHACFHETIEDRVYLSTDRKTLDMRQPIANIASVRLVVNDEVEIPSEGLTSQAQITGQFSEPFLIIKDEGELIILGSLDSVRFVLPLGSITAQEVKAIFDERYSGNYLRCEAKNGYLTFTDLGFKGLSSTIKVSGLATAALGFQRQKGATGNVLYPAWSLRRKTNQDRFLYPYFETPIKANPYFKISYTVPRSFCLRCKGTGVENDYRFDAQGNVFLIANEDVLYQTALKIILTHRGSNFFHPEIGTSLHTFIGKKAVNSVSAAIAADVRRALLVYQNIQKEQAKYQQVTLKERLYQIVKVTVNPHKDNPTIFLLEVVVTNASQDPVNLSIVFTVPSVFVLAPDGTVQNF